MSRVGAMFRSAAAREAQVWAFNEQEVPNASEFRMIVENVFFLQTDDVRLKFFIRSGQTGNAANSGQERADGV